MQQLLDTFSYIACNSTIASNKQRQEQNNLATTKEQNSRDERSKSLHLVKS